MTRPSLRQPAGSAAFIVAEQRRFTDIPLLLEPDKVVEVPLEATYHAAFAEVPQRWRRVLGVSA